MKKIELKNIDQVIYYDECSNGLPIYMIENKNVADYYITLSVKYGSLDTDFKINDKLYHVNNGVAHFLEHVNFNIDDKTTAHDLFRNLGSNINAFTTFDFTSYEVSSNNHFKENLDLLLDYVQTRYFTKEIVDKEKGIIIEEVRIGDNNPGKKMFFECNKALYHNSKRRYYITGNEEDVTNITKEELELVFDNFYVPNNMFIIITGNFNHNEASKITKDNQKDKKFKHNKIEKIKEKEPNTIVTPYKEIIDKQIEIPKIRISYKMNKDIYKDKDLEEVLSYLYMIIQNNIGSTSLFKEELMEKELITLINGGVSLEDDYLIFGVSIESKYPDKVIDMVIDKLKHMTCNEEELTRSRRVRIADLIYSYDDIEYVNTDIMDQLIRYNKIYDNLYEVYNNSNIEECKDILNKLDFTNQSIIVMKNN